MSKINNLKMEEKELVVDVTTLLKWSRSPVGIIRTQLEFVHYLIANDRTVKYFRFNETKDALLEVSFNEIQQQVTHLLNYKNKTASSHHNIKNESISTSIIDFGILKKVWRVYKNEGWRPLAIKICKNICTEKQLDMLKKVYIQLFLESKSSPSKENLKKSIETILFSPEIQLANVMDVDFLTKNSIVISIGLDWDYSNYPLLYWLKQKIGFEFVGAFYDGIPIVYPELVQSDYFSKMFFSHIYYLTHLSDRIFCISDYSKQQLKEIYKAHQISKYPQLKTIHLGDSVFKNEVQAISKKRGHKKDYVLYVSTIEARKNHLLLLKVWQKLQKEQFHNLPDLVLVGMYGWGIDDVQELYQNDNDLKKIIHFYDDVDDEELVTMYKGSKFTVFPSFVEGWGLGAVESMLYGKVCLISNCDALIEATQGLMPALPPTDVDLWADMIKDFVSNPNALDEYAQIIRQDFKSRSWAEFSSEFAEFARGET